MNLIFAVSKDVLVRAGQNTIMGISIVFVMLLLISFLISLFKLLGRFSAENRKTAVDEAPASPAPIETVDEADDLELVAVITAAIHAYEEAQGNDIPADALVVRSIKKINKSKWQNA